MHIFMTATQQKHFEHVLRRQQAELVARRRAYLAGMTRSVNAREVLMQDADDDELAFRAPGALRQVLVEVDVVAELERLRPLTLTWAMARDIRHAVRGGRMPAWAQPVVEWLGLTPIAKIKPSGRMGMAGGLFGKK